MKKILVLTMALLLCCGCNEKKTDDSIPEEITEASDTYGDTDVTDNTDESENSQADGDGGAVSEDGFRNYEASDFNIINVTISNSSNKTPIELKSWDIPDIDFGERLAPCKTSDDPSQFYNVNYYSGIIISNSDTSFYMENIDTPEKGAVQTAFKKDNMMYLIVNYDVYCALCHEWSLFSYDTESGETKEIYRYSGLDDMASNVYSPVIAGNKLFFLSFPMASDKGFLRAIDLDSGAIETVCENIGPYSSIYSCSSGKVRFYSTDESPDFSTNLTINTIKEYDTVTGELTTITENEKTKMFDICPGELAVYLRKPMDSKNCEVVSENYLLKTDFRNASLLYASDKKVIIITNDEKHELHTYDLEKMECYVTKLGALSALKITHNGNILLTQNRMDGDITYDYYAASPTTITDLYYFIPELGLSFLIDQMHSGYLISYDLVSQLNDKGVFIQFSDKLISPDENGDYYYEITPEKIYCIEDSDAAAGQ